MSELHHAATLEIFRDLRAGDVDLSPAKKGISLVDEIVEGIEVVGDKRRLRILEDEEKIYPDKINWPQFSADFNLVIATRALMDRRPSPANHQVIDDHQIAGITYIFKDGATVSLVNASTSGAEVVVAHEVAHMFGVRKPTVENGMMEHCDRSDCIMYSNRERPQKIRIDRGGFNRVLEATGLIKTHYETKPTQEEFCADCKDELRRQAFFRKQRNAGKYIPDSWL